MQIREIMKGYEVVLHKEKVGGYWVEAPALPGCLTQGKNREDALRNMKEAMELYLEVKREDEIRGAKLRFKKTKMITIPREEYESLLETIEILSDKKTMKAIERAEKNFKEGKYMELKDFLKDGKFRSSKKLSARAYREVNGS